MNPHSKAFFKGLRDAFLIGLFLVAALYADKLKDRVFASPLASQDANPPVASTAQR